jgi:membrane-associated protease RseP (regulator of RpoE activity)
VSDTLHRPPASGDPEPSWPQQGASASATSIDQQPPDDRDEAETSTSDRWLGLVLLAAAIIGLGLLAGVHALVMVLAIVVSIFLHELGHYLVARWTGMKVTEFFIGFGPKLWSFHRGETEYGVKLIFAGAYVRIIGMSNLEEVDPEDEPRTYRAQSYWKRLPVVLAGPFANFLIAFVLLFVVFAGLGTPKAEDWRIGSVVQGSSADAAGLQLGDRIVAVDGEPVSDWEGLIDAVQPTAGRPVSFVIERDGVERTATTVVGWRLTEQGAGSIISVSEEGTDALPLRRNDRVLAVDGQPVGTYDEFARQLAERPPGEASITFARESPSIDDSRSYEYIAHRVKVPVQLPAEGYVGFFGISQEVDSERLPPAEAAGESADRFGFLIVKSVEGIYSFFSPAGLTRYADLVASTPPTGTEVDVNATPIIETVDVDAPEASFDAAAVNPDRPSSIFGIVRLGSQAAEGGAVEFLLLLVVVNVFLGLFNLVPLPPLDGGHAAVATYEAIRGAISHRAYRVNMAKLMPLTYVVVVLLVGLFITSTYLDIVDPAPNPFGP